MKNTSNKFGTKINELIETVSHTENWREYVTQSTADLIDSLFRNMNITAVMEEQNITYTNLRNRLLTANKRIKNKSTSNISGNSENSKKLFSIIEKYPNWKNGLSENEIEYIENYLQLKNYNAVAKKLNKKLGNVYMAIHGSKQHTGAIQKILNNNEKQAM